MATEIIRYADVQGQIYETEAEADTADAVLESLDRINEFVATHYPAKEGGTRPSPRATIVRNALRLWISEQRAYA